MLSALRECREKGYLIGISTSRSEQNCLSFLGDLSPDMLITSGGALIKKDEQYIFSAVFSSIRTKEIISLARGI
ncbi:MAG: HAD family hydrolase [Lachnospiraceae bacterium]|nr:HAD family hydrolase [Lachnospiraceae bacterium]